MADFEIAEFRPRPFAHVSRRATVADIADVMGRAFHAIAEAFARAGVPLSGPAYAHYTGQDEGSVTFEVGFAVRAEETDRLRQAGLAIGETLSGRAMRAIHTGAYAQLPSVYQAMQARMTATKLEGTPDMWECYHSPPGTPEALLKTEILWPVRPRS